MTKPDLAPGTGPTFKTNIDEVLAFNRAHKSYTPPLDEEPVDCKLSKFDDLRRYGISAKPEDGLWASIGGRTPTSRRFRL